MTFVEPKIDVVLGYLNQINQDKTPEWGSMSATRMVEHLTDTLDLALGKLELSLEIPEDKVERAQGFILSEHPMPKNFQASFAPPSAGIRHSNISEAILEFKKKWAEFDEYYSLNKGITHLHPNFGKLNYELWKRLHSKHVTHHLEQFGINL